MSRLAVLGECARGRAPCCATQLLIRAVSHVCDLCRQALEYCIDFCFLIDFMLNFRTAVQTVEGLVDVTPAGIARHYISGWFTVDMLSTFPFVRAPRSLPRQLALPPRRLLLTAHTHTPCRSSCWRRFWMRGTPMACGTLDW